MDLQATMSAYREKSARLRVFDEGIKAILREKSGRRLLRREEEKEYLTPRQWSWEQLRYFHEAGMVNNADLFPYLWLIDEERAAFEEIGAVKTLAAAESLRDLRRRYDALAGDARGDFWDEIQEECRAAFQRSDGMLGFADLLIRHAESHPEEFPEGEARDRLAELEKKMRGDAEQTAEGRSEEKEAFKRGMGAFLKSRGQTLGGGMKELLEAAGQTPEERAAGLKRFAQELDAAGGLDELAQWMEKK